MSRVFFAVLSLFLLFGSPIHAADAGNVSIPKIGVVDVQTVTSESEPAKAAKAQLEARYGKERADLEKQGAALKKQAESLKNPKASEQKKVDFIKAKQKLDRAAQNYMRKVQQDEVKLRQDMITLIFQAAYEVAKAKGFTYVVDVTTGGVLYADPSMDITKDVLAEVNRIYAQNKDKQPEAPAKKK